MITLVLKYYYLFLNFKIFTLISKTPTVSESEILLLINLIHDIHT